MKFVWKAIKENKMVAVIMAAVMVLFIESYLNVYISRNIPRVLDTKGINAIEQISWFIILCIESIIISTFSKRSNIIHQKLYTVLMNQLIDKVLDVDLLAFEDFSIDKIESMRGYINNISNSVKFLYQLLFAIVSIINTAYIIYTINEKAVISVILFVIIISISLKYLNKKYNDINTQKKDLFQERNKELSEAIQGFREVRYFNAKENIREKLHALNNKSYELGKETNGVNVFITLVINVSYYSFLIIGIFYGLELIKAGISTAETVTMLLLIESLVRPVYSLTTGVDQISEVKISVEELSKFMGYKNKIHDGYLEFSGFEDSIELENVSCEYDTSSTVLENINIKINKGQRIGICGESGSGKSTLLKLITRAFDVCSGNVKIDGIDIRKLKIDSFRKFIGVVSQEVHIFNSTIRENIAYALQTHKATEEEIVEACKKAKLWKFIKSLPQGLDTQVGDNGFKLSGGQKQRISLARIMLADPQIIILDEATSALDNCTENAVKKVLAKMKGKTIIAVAHRLTTIQDYDKIIVVANKHILTEGAHEELLQSCDMYRRMYNAINEDDEDE